MAVVPLSARTALGGVRVRGSVGGWARRAWGVAAVGWGGGDAASQLPEAGVFGPLRGGWAPAGQARQRGSAWGG
jgi:hypothetical protein